MGKWGPFQGLGFRVVITGVISRATRVIAHIKGLITTHEPPSSVGIVGSSPFSENATCLRPFGALQGCTGEWNPTPSTLKFQKVFKISQDTGLRKSSTMSDSRTGWIVRHVDVKHTIVATMTIIVLENHHSCDPRSW